jgi:nucleotide-binding universal stress UspA family protein
VIALNKILVATDFSEPSRVALETGQSLAEAFKAELHLLHVVADLLHEPWVGYAPAVKFMDLIERFQASARARLQGLVASGDLAKGRIVIATAVGSPAEEILKYSDRHNIDVIVCGTHGRGKLDRMVMGSTAERIVRLARCPVLTVRFKADQTSIAA